MPFLTEGRARLLGAKRFFLLLLFAKTVATVAKKNFGHIMASTRVDPHIVLFCAILADQPKDEE